MDKPRVGGVWIGDLAHLKLLDVPQPLEGRGVNNFALTFREMDIAVYDVNDERPRAVNRR